MSDRHLVYKGDQSSHLDGCEVKVVAVRVGGLVDSDGEAAVTVP